MRKVLVLLTLAVLSFVACNKSQDKPAVGAKHPADAVQNKLAELAGPGAQDCGRLASQEPGQLQVASDCATKAAKDKKPFYVAYDLPGMTVAVAGNAEGKLSTVQQDQAGELQFGPCPAELRVAPSGRVTCFAPGSMGMGGMSPHGSAQPGMPPAGTPNPHAGGTPTPSKQH